ncbi:hypothetical protein [Streptomyces sp.]|nr:hypothetical protein [Streptomyces sp.]
MVFCLRLPETKARLPGRLALGLDAVDAQGDVLGDGVGEHGLQGLQP